MLWIKRRSKAVCRTAASRLRGRIIGDVGALLMLLHRGIFWLWRPRLLVARLRDMNALYRSRQQLKDLEPRLRADLGLDDDDVQQELARPLASAVSPWASSELQQAVRDSQTTGRNKRDTEAANPSFYHMRGRPTATRCTGIRP